MIKTIHHHAGNTATANVNVGAGVSITPSAPAAVAPQASLQLTAAGGSGGGYTWSFVTNASGATVSPAGLYKAGRNLYRQLFFRTKGLPVLSDEDRLKFKAEFAGEVESLSKLLDRDLVRLWGYER